MATNTYDAIVIGGGHNGLTAGAYFARHGARTVVLEARHKTGGAADTSAPFADHPDINVTTYSYVMSLMPPTIIDELQLKTARLRRHAVRPVLPGVSRTAARSRSTPTRPTARTTRSRSSRRRTPTRSPSGRRG